MRDLGCRPHRQLAGGGERLHQHAARLDRVRDQPLLAVALLDRDLRVRELLVHFARSELPRVAAVRAEVVVEDRRAILERPLRIDDRGQRLVLHLDKLRRVASLRARLREHDRHAVADVARLVDGQRTVIRLVRVLRR